MKTSPNTSVEKKVHKKVTRKEFMTTANPDQIRAKCQEYYETMKDWEEVFIQPNIALQKIPALSIDEKGYLGLKIIPFTPDGKPMHNKAIMITWDREWVDQILSAMQHFVFTPILTEINTMNAQLKANNNAVRDAKKQKKVEEVEAL